MRDILKRIFIGVAIGMALFFLKSEVFAASLTPTSTQYDARYAVTNCQGIGTCYPTSWGSWQGTVNMGTAIVQPSPSGTNPYVLTQLSLKYNYSSSFVAGNTYNFKVRVNVSSADPVAQYVKYWSVTGVRGGDTTSTLEYSNINAYTLQRAERDADDPKVFYLYISVTPAINVKYIWMYVGGIIGPTTLNNINNGNVVVRNGGVTYSEGTNSYIQQTTNAIYKLTEVFRSGNEEVLDADAPADTTYNNDYSTTAYDTAESNVNSYMDVDVSSLTWNPATWVHAFTWIWATLTSFVQINAKVFATITGFLTFSFVGLVLGRG